MKMMMLKSNTKLEYRKALGNGEVLQHLLDEHPGLKYGDYYESRRAGDRFEVEFETIREGVDVIVLSEILFNGTLSDKHHYILRKSELENLFSHPQVLNCCED